jgi:hypothetical protein
MSLLNLGRFHMETGDAREALRLHEVAAPLFGRSFQSLRRCPRPSRPGRRRRGPAAPRENRRRSRSAARRIREPGPAQRLLRHQATLFRSLHRRAHAPARAESRRGLC